MPDFKGNPNLGSIPLRQALLEDAITATTEDRNKTYGEPRYQLDFAGDLITRYRRQLSISRASYIPAHNFAIETILLKISRIACGSFHRDNYLDIAAYAAIAFEVEQLARDEAKPPYTYEKVSYFVCPDCDHEYFTIEEVIRDGDDCCVESIGIVLRRPKAAPQVREHPEDEGL